MGSLQPLDKRSGLVKLVSCPDVCPSADFLGGLWGVCVPNTLRSPFIPAYPLLHPYLPEAPRGKYVCDLRHLLATNIE